MGLGLFIAKTLLERTGARLDFGNGGGARRETALRPAGFARRRGAIVTVVWPRARVATTRRAGAGPLAPMRRLQG